MYFAVLVLFIIFLVTVFRNIKKPYKYPPGPKWLPIIGSFLEIKSMKSKLGYQHLVWDKLAKDYGPVVGLRLGLDLIVIVSGINGIREIFTKEEFDGRPDGFFFKMRTFGKRLGIVFSDGHLWQKQRKFSLHHLKQFGYGRKEMEEQISKEVKVLIENLTHECSKPFDVHRLFDVTVINVLWSMMAGERFDLNDIKLKQLLTIINDMFRSTDISGGMLNQMPFLRFIVPDKCGYNLHLSILQRMWTFLEETVKEHKKYACSTYARDLIDAFLQKMDNGENGETSTFTDEQLLSLCLDLFMAGSETTSNTLEFIVLYLVKYVDVQSRMQEEMDNVIGRNRWPTLQDRNRLPYVDAVINEVQRISNVAPVGISHRATRDSELLGHYIPEGTILLTNLYGLHMDENFWKDPHVFRPERFLEPQENSTIQDLYFAPFGYGRRRCLGESLAKANLFLVTTALFHNFSVVPFNGNEPPCLKGLDGVTLSPKPYQVLLKPRL